MKVDHCCYVEGRECEFLTFVESRPRCSLYEHWGALLSLDVWLESPIGRFFARRFPGFDCGDFPQNMPPELLPEGTWLCCFEFSDHCRFGGGNSGDAH